MEFFEKRGFAVNWLWFNLHLTCTDDKYWKRLYSVSIVNQSLYAYDCWKSSKFLDMLPRRAEAVLTTTHNLCIGGKISNTCVQYSFPYNWVYNVHRLWVLLLEPTNTIVWAASWENRNFVYEKTKASIDISFAVTVFATGIVQFLFSRINPKFQASNPLL